MANDEYHLMFPESDRVPAPKRRRRKARPTPRPLPATYPDWVILGDKPRSETVVTNLPAIEEKPEGAEDFQKRYLRNFLRSLSRRAQMFLQKATMPCSYCGTPLRYEETTVDHIVPSSRGGNNQPKNLALCCKACNNLKGSKTVEELMKLLESPPPESTP